MVATSTCNSLCLALLSKTLVVAQLLTHLLFDSNFHVHFYSLEDCSSYFLDTEKSSFLPSLECQRLELADRLRITSSFSNGSDCCIIG